MAVGFLDMEAYELLSVQRAGVRVIALLGVGLHRDSKQHISQFSCSRRNPLR
jgi:hypothetical protein